MISSVTQAFCHDCSRARLSTEGKLYLCLFASQGHDLRPMLRDGASDGDIASAIGHIWQGRADRYSELRALRGPDDSAPDAAAPRRVEMSYIGG
ncbi:GTP 3',8-cyclase [compost metagenome]